MRASDKENHSASPSSGKESLIDSLAFLDKLLEEQTKANESAYKELNTDFKKLDCQLQAQIKEV